VSSSITVTNLRTGRVHEIPYTPYPDLAEGDMFVRLPGSHHALLSQLEGRFDEATGLFTFPEGYPLAMSRRGFPVYRRRCYGSDECLEVESC
jgi:hypothetical protein